MIKIKLFFLIFGLKFDSICLIICFLEVKFLIMKSRFQNNSVYILLLILTLFSLNGIAQEKTRKQLKEEAKIEKQKWIENLVNSKEFVFKADRVIPQGMRNIELIEDYTVEFHPDTIKSDLPFFGRGFSGIGYGGDNGLKFKGKPKVYTIEKTKKSYIIKVEVKGEQDYFSLLLSVHFDGGAYLSVNSNNRSSISYDGNVKSIEKK